MHTLEYGEGEMESVANWQTFIPIVSCKKNKGVVVYTGALQSFEHLTHCPVNLTLHEKGVINLWSQWHLTYGSRLKD